MQSRINGIVVFYTCTNHSLLDVHSVLRMWLDFTSGPADTPFEPSVLMQEYPIHSVQQI